MPIFSILKFSISKLKMDLAQLATLVQNADVPAGRDYRYKYGSSTFVTRVKAADVGHKKQESRGFQWFLYE
jgi:hypothetical protein